MANEGLVWDSRTFIHTIILVVTGILGGGVDLKLTNFLEKKQLWNATHLLKNQVRTLNTMGFPGVISNDLGLENKHQEGQCQVPGGLKCVGKTMKKTFFGL